MIAKAPASAPAPGMPNMKQQHMGGGGVMMHMTFFWGKSVQILFTGWPGDQAVRIYLLCLFCILVELLSTVSLGVAQPNPPAINVLCQTVLHAMRIGLAYVVMLAVIAFIVGVLIAAIMGHACPWVPVRWEWPRPKVEHAGEALHSTKC